MKNNRLSSKLCRSSNLAFFQQLLRNNLRIDCVTYSFRNVLIIATCWLISTQVYAQRLDGHWLKDHLVTASHPGGCNPGYVTGWPDDSTWVNFYDGMQMDGLFSQPHSDLSGPDLLLESSFNSDNINLKLKLANGTTTTALLVDGPRWKQISDTTWVFAFTDCNMGIIPNSRWVAEIDFSADFGLNASQQVVGLEIEFLLTNGMADLAGAYIINPKCESLAPLQDKYICSEETILIGDSLPIAGSYFWNTGATSSTISVSAPGTYWYARSKETCVWFDTVTVFEYPIPSFELTLNTFDCNSKIAHYRTSLPVTWPNGSESPIYSSDELNVNASLAYKCGFVNEQISIPLPECPHGVYLPNAFTPNSDGINEGFKPVFEEQPLAYHLQIYSRWGELVFDSHDWKEHWDGGKWPQGIYNCVLTYRFLKHTEESRFVVRLIR